MAMTMLVVVTLALLALSLAQSTPCCVPQAQQGVYFPNCGDYTPFGKDRCAAINQGKSCIWSNDCDATKTCQRFQRIVDYFGVKVDVGRCGGLCADKTVACEPVFVPKVIQLATGASRTVSVISKCDCGGCRKVDLYTSIEINQGSCQGKCPSDNPTVVCSAGVQDSFSLANGPEPATPSAALFAKLSTICGFGVSPLFDNPVIDRCFGHTFTCVQRRECPLRRAVLRICLGAVLGTSLTYTDSLMLGTNGLNQWALRIPDLPGAGGTWQQGGRLCVDLDLANLPASGSGVTSILADVVISGHLDVAVQDDTMVDYATLTLDYEQCQVCRPQYIVNNLLLTSGGVQTIPEIKSCGCFDYRACTRQPLHYTYFPGTSAEQTVDVGQCLGRCPFITADIPSHVPFPFRRCAANSSASVSIKDIQGNTVSVSVVKTCACQ